MSSEDPNVWRDLLAGASAIIATLTGGLWMQQAARVDKLEDKVESKVDSTSCSRHQDSQNAIWTELRNLRQDMNNKHIELIQIINGKMK